MTLPEKSISRVVVHLAGRVAFGPFVEIPEFGWCTLIHITTGGPIPAGILLQGLRRSANFLSCDFTISPAYSESLAEMVARFFGLPACLDLVCQPSQMKFRRGYTTGDSQIILAGDTLRRYLAKDFGYSEANRIENLRLTAEVTKLVADSGLMILVSTVSSD